MQYLNKTILCLEGKEFIKTPDNPKGLVPKGTYDSLKSRGQIIVHGRGGNGSNILIEFETMPELYRRLVIQSLGDPYEYAAIQPIRDLIKLDIKALRFFEKHELPDGRLLPDDHQRQYVKAASVMNMITEVYADKKWLKKEVNISLGQFWEILGKMKEVADAGLPSSRRKLEPKWQEYKEHSYAALISKKFCNDNRAKVTAELANLLLSLYAQDNKPYASDVLDAYKLFLEGKKEIVDLETGELIDPLQFYIDGEPIEISKTTVWNIINSPVNRITVDKIRLSKLEFSSKHRPYVMREAPMYAFSKITMDDISIPFKMPDGKRVWSYQIFDVASGAVIGKAFARSNDEGSGKSRELFKQSMMDMFRMIIRNGWGMPAEIEVEQHISNTFKGKVNEVGEFVADLLTEGYLFPFVRFCNPANPQEKRAEGFIKGKKYKHQNKREGFQRRPFAKLEANRMNEDKNKVRYTFDEVVANELHDIQEWNNTLHPKQDIYPGLTRWQVLEQHQNPQLVRPHLPTVAKYIGLKTPTSISRGYVTVQYGKYMVSENDMPKLDSTIVTAHYLKDKDNQIPEIYLFQSDEYVCTAVKMNAFNESRVEQTEEDLRIKSEQQSNIARFDANVKNRVKTLKKLVVVSKEANSYELPEEESRETLTETPVAINDQDFDIEFWNEKAINDL